MSATKEQPDDLLQRFVDLAAEKGISVRCPACGSEEGWNLYTHKGAHQVIPGGRGRDILIGPVGIDVLTMRCRNCGYIRMFDLNYIKGGGPKDEPAQTDEDDDERSGQE